MAIEQQPGDPLADAVERVRAALAGTAGVDDWALDGRRDEERQLYLIGERVESRRLVTNERMGVAIVNDHPAASDGARARGDAALALPAVDIADAVRLAGRLGSGVEMARLAGNPPFRLPDPPAGGYPDVVVADARLLDDPAAALDTLRERLEAAVAREPEVRLASAELFVTRSAHLRRTSRGAAASYPSASVMLDAILLASDGSQTVEYHAEPQRRRLRDLALEGAVAAWASFARDSLRAVLPETITGPVILSGEALSGLFTPVIFHAGARAAFERVSRLTPGEPITEAPPRGDRITLASDPTRPYGNDSAPMLADGLPARRVPVIEDGVLRRIWGDARYAAYLGVPPTGAFANPTVALGATPLVALRDAGDGPVYEIVAFSWLMPDPISGSFVAEIKLGYRHDRHGALPIKGGSVSGNLFTMLEDCRLATEGYSDGTYYGPAAIRFASLSIAGA